MNSRIIREFADIILGIEDNDNREQTAEGIGAILASMGGDFDWAVWRARCRIQRVWADIEEGFND